VTSLPTSHLILAASGGDFQLPDAPGPNGAIFGSTSGLTGAQMGPITVPVTGTYLVLVGSFDSGFDGTGTYSLTASVAP